MISIVTAVLALSMVTIVCLAYQPTRLIGVVGFLLMAYLNPIALLFCVACFAAIAVLIYLYQRSNTNVIPRLPD